jgi:hypothetical protein
MVKALSDQAARRQTAPSVRSRLRPFQLTQKFLLRGQEFGAVDFGEGLPFLHVLSRVVHMKLLDPAFKLAVHGGEIPLVILDPAHGPDGPAQWFDSHHRGLEADELLFVERNLDGRHFLGFTLRRGLCLGRLLGLRLRSAAVARMLDQGRPAGSAKQNKTGKGDGQDQGS